VIDIVPTLLEAAKLPAPQFVDGIQQQPIEGTSIGYSFDEAKAAERHTTQYFEMFANRGIYHLGWTACTKHAVPWVLTGTFPKFEDDVWELYAPDDWSQANNPPPATPPNCGSYSNSFCWKAPNTTCSRWTTARRNVSIPISRDGRTCWRAGPP
jgi:arylsulfatase A-like enzyme